MACCVIGLFQIMEEKAEEKWGFCWLSMTEGQTEGLSLSQDRCSLMFLVFWNLKFAAPHCLWSGSPSLRSGWSPVM